MMATYPRIAGYTFQAEIFCPTCTFIELTGQRPMFDIETELDDYAKVHGINRYEEGTFDSGDFPKVIFSIQLEHREHCGRCGERL